MTEEPKTKRVVIRFKLVNGKAGTMLGELDDTAETIRLFYLMIWEGFK